MARTVTLRPWQKAALERVGAIASSDFLAVATPGAGKTTFALTAARQALAGDPSLRLIVVVPTAHLKVQWAQAASNFDLHLDWRWSAADGCVAPDMHGIITTYQQVAACADALRALADNAMVIFDEIHHAAEDRAWGDALGKAFETAPRRLALSGTPFRSDTHAIPFVRYAADEAVADYEYGYGDALADGGVVRPVYFPRIDGMMEWSAPDGSARAHGFEDPLGAPQAGQRLRTAYSVGGEWLPHVLRQAHEQLLAIRQRQPEAGGLVIATDQEHARAIARLMADRLKVRAAVATSDDPDASACISRFASGTEPWIVAVRMAPASPRSPDSAEDSQPSVAGGRRPDPGGHGHEGSGQVSEGVDIPRLRVGVFATTTTTELFFRQAVGRLVRWTRGSSGQKSFLYIPDEPRLRARAFAIAEQRRHSLRHQDRELTAQDRRDGAGDDEQISLFAPISAVPLADEDSPDWVLDGDGSPDPPADPMLTISLPPLPTGGPGAQGPSGLAPDGRTRREHKEHLRKANADRGRVIAHHTGMTHAGVNAELNRVIGLSRISEATVEQLERRLDKADQWLRQASGRRVG